MPAKNTQAKTKRTSHTISFRVDGEVLSQLQKGAAPYGMSVHDYARQRLLDSLENRGESQILEEVSETRRGVENLRSDVANALEVILYNTAKDNTKGDLQQFRMQIRGWVDKNLRHRDQP